MGCSLYVRRPLRGGVNRNVKFMLSISHIKRRPLRGGVNRNVFPLVNTYLINGRPLRGGVNRNIGTDILSINGSVAPFAGA